MMKEIAIFTVSSSILIYFLTPVSEESEPAPEIPAEIMKEIEGEKPSTQSASDSWDYDDGDDYEEEEFVFGQPLTGDGDDDYDQEGTGQKGVEASEIKGPDDLSSSNFEIVQSENPNRAHPDSPTGNQRGSQSNPIVFATNNPVDPVDD